MRKLTTATPNPSEFKCCQIVDIQLRVAAYNRMIIVV